MLIRRKLQRLGQKGDTLVEVLIAIAVVSVILGGAYVTTNTSLRATRGSQERSDALKLTEGQLEALKSMSSITDSPLFKTLPNKFCISGTSTVIDQMGAAGAQCTVNAAGSPSTAQPSYTMKISRQADGHTFSLTTSWFAVEASGGTNTIQMSYRLYQQ